MLATRLAKAIGASLDYLVGAFEEQGHHA